MADNKKKVIIYAEWISIFEKLSDLEAGKLIKHFFSYVNDLDPEPPDRLTELLFEPIKLTLKRDLKKWKEEIEKQSKAGRMGNLKRYNTDLYNGVLLKSISLGEAEEIALTRKLSPPDKKTSPPDKKTPDLTKNVAVNDNDNDNDNDNINTINNTFPEKPEKIDFIELIINSFSEQFEKYRGFSYHISNKKIERSMAGKILKAYKQNTKNTGKTSEQTINELTDFFEKCMLITDKYINETMSLSTIINQFNKILNILKNGNTKRKNEPATSNEQLANVFAKHFANDYPTAE